MTVYKYNQNASIYNATGGQRDLNKNAEYQRFSEEYFSGQDVRLYFGDMWVDEVVGLQFVLQENVAPIFGYASYTYDAVAKGSRQIQGSFRINFKESYYLHFIINRLESKLGTVKSGGQVIDGYGQLLPTAFTPDKMVSQFASGADFEKAAYEFEQSLWGNGSAVRGPSSSGVPNQTTRTIQRGKSSFFASADAAPTVNKEGFSITVYYGPYTQSYNPNATTEKIATTAHTLTGVHLTGVSQIVDGSGQPLYEEYSFIAKDLDGNTSLMKTQPKYSFGDVQ